MKSYLLDRGLIESLPDEQFEVGEGPPGNTGHYVIRPYH